VERATRHARRKAALAGLLTIVALACATIEPPPGGPPDAAPPILLSVVPDSASVLTNWDKEVEFQFNEVVSEAGRDGLASLIRVSPRHEEIHVSWRRSRITVKPRDGWRPGEVYTVTLLPGITDLRTNRLDSGRTVVFSTGGPIPSTEMSGSVVNWEDGRIAVNALVEAIRVRDSVTYFGVSDSTGLFGLHAVPPGRYLLVASVDENRNRRRDAREAFDSVTVQLDSIVTHDLWMFVRDTIGPRIRTVSLVDSVSVAAEFDQALAPEPPAPEAIRALLLPDSVPVPVARVMWRPTFDSLVAARRDSIAAARDTMPPDSAAAPPVARPTPAPTRPPAAPTIDTLAQASAQDSVRRANLLRQRPPLYKTIVMIFDAPLTPGERYVIEATVSNPLGTFQQSLRVVSVPARPDST
jgi:Bacterial Ig-like domain